MRTQHNFYTQQLRYAGITLLVIYLDKVCALKVRTNSFQEVLEAVLFGGWSIPPTAHRWLLCGSPTRVSTKFILSVGLILFELTRISNNALVWYFDFGRKLEIFARVGLSHMSELARQNLSPTWKYYLRTAVRALCAGNSVYETSAVCK